MFLQGKRKNSIFQWNSSVILKKGESEYLTQGCCLITFTTFFIKKKNKTNSFPSRLQQRRHFCDLIISLWGVCVFPPHKAFVYKGENTFPPMAATGNTFPLT